MNKAELNNFSVETYDSQLQDHIDQLEAAIARTDDLKEKEKGRAAIRRFRAAMEGGLKK